MYHHARLLFAIACFFALGSDHLAAAPEVSPNQEKRNTVTSPTRRATATPSKQDASGSGSAGSGAVRPDDAPAPVHAKASRSACLVHFYYGDSYFTTLFQETLKLKKAMEGYSKVVLLKAEESPSWLDFSEKDEKLADIKDEPTKENLFKYLIELAEDGYYIDLYIFAHGNPGEFSAMPKGARKDKIWITEQGIRDNLAPAATGFIKMPIRIVWGTYCYGQTLGNVWRDVGAKATAGARFVQFYPNSFGPFIDDWNKGNISFDQAVGEADTDAVRTAGQLYITGHALSTRGVWGGCPLGKTVLGSDSCAKDYFLRWRGRDPETGKWGGWLDNEEWQSDKNGKENMNYSSYMFRGGDKYITKDYKPSW